MTRKKVIKMKKFTLLVPILLLGLTLSACGNSKSAESSSSSKASSSATSSVSSNNSSTSSSAATSSSNTSTTTSTSTRKENKAVTTAVSGSRISQLNKQLESSLGNIALPQDDGLTNGSNNLNIRYTGSSSNYQIFYSVGNTPTSFNNPTLTQQNAYAVLQKQSFGSKSDAASQINYLPASGNQGLPTVNLGSGITGYKDQGAGNIHLLWNEGHWSLSVHAINIENQDPTPLAKQTVTLLNQYFLPAPNKIGQISFDVNIEPGARDQVISWQDGSSVYTLSAHDPATAIKMVASIK